MEVKNFETLYSPFLNIGDLECTAFLPHIIHSWYKLSISPLIEKFNISFLITEKK